MFKRAKAAFVLAVVVFAADVASATPVLFQGGEFDVVVSDLGGDVYQFVYTADFTGWDDSTDDDFITAIDFGLDGWNDIGTVTLVSDTAPGTWVVVQGNASANNCNSNLNQFKICAEENPLNLLATTENDQIYTWTINVAYDSIGDPGVLTSDSNPIKAVFYTLDCQTKKDPQTKEEETVCEPKQSGNLSRESDVETTTEEPNTTDEPTTTDAPEPALLGLLGAGLLVASRRLRRKS